MRLKREINGCYQRIIFKQRKIKKRSPTTCNETKTKLTRLQTEQINDDLHIMRYQTKTNSKTKLADYMIYVLEEIYNKIFHF